MSDPVRQLEALLAQVAATVGRLEAKVDALTKARPTGRLLSKRAAARLLGVDRGTTLEALVRDGHLRLVMGKIPDTEIERLLVEGLPEGTAPTRRRERLQRDEAAAIRSLKV